MKLKFVMNEVKINKLKFVMNEIEIKIIIMSK